MWRLVKTLNLKDLRSKIERQRKREKERRARLRLIPGGRTPEFLEDRARNHFNSKTNNDLSSSTFLQKTLVEHSHETRGPQHTAASNSDTTEYKSTSVLHREGGWSKEINSSDMDLLERTKKKMQKEETFIDTLPQIAKEAEYLVRQNNTICLCDRYVKKPTLLKLDAKPHANVVSVYKCPTRGKRPISKITFSPDNKGRMAVSYCPYEFDPILREHSCEAFFWDSDNRSRPESMVRAPAQIVDINYHQKDVQNICGSLFTGQVAKWDLRVGPNLQTISAIEVSHEDVSTSAMWINSKTGFEFFSSGLDGSIIWWDERNLSERLDMVYADPEKGRSERDKAMPISVLDYEHSLPTKFLIGSQFGQVMVFMKKGKTPEERLTNLYKAHKGPVRAIHRNPVFIKNFMSCGDYHLRIFAEDCRDSGIMWTAPTDALYTYAHWLPKRPCGLVASRTDGCLEFWDLLVRNVSSVLTTKVSEDALSSVCPAEGGRLIAAGTVNGEIRMVKICSSFQSFDKSDKSTLAASFERESRREKYLEQRNREMRLAKKNRETRQKQKEENGEDDKDSIISSDLISHEGLLEDKSFFEKLEQEKKVDELNATNKSIPIRNFQDKPPVIKSEDEEAKEAGKDR